MYSCRKRRLSQRSQHRVMRRGWGRCRSSRQGWHRERADDRTGAHASHNASGSYCPHFVPILTAVQAAEWLIESFAQRYSRPQHSLATGPGGYHRRVYVTIRSETRNRQNPARGRIPDQLDGGGAGDRTRVRSRVPCDIYECSPGIDLTRAAPWDQARLRPASVYVPPGAEAPPGGEAAGINVGSDFHSREAGRRQAEA